MTTTTAAGVLLRWGDGDSGRPRGPQHQLPAQAGQAGGGGDSRKNRLRSVPAVRAEPRQFTRLTLTLGTTAPGPAEAADGTRPGSEAMIQPASAPAHQLVDFSPISREATDICPQCPQRSPQVSQDCNHHSRDRTVLLFPF